MTPHTHLKRHSGEKPILIGMTDIGQGLRGVAVFLILLSLSPILADSRENKGEEDITYLHDKIFANICKDTNLIEYFIIKSQEGPNYLLSQWQKSEKPVQHTKMQFLELDLLLLMSRLRVHAEYICIYLQRYLNY